MKKLFSGAALLAVTACNQVVYDEIYKNIIQQALRAREENHVVLEKRNEAIERLRELCQGQVSSYERDEPAAQRWD